MNINLAVIKALLRDIGGLAALVMAGIAAYRAWPWLNASVHDLVLVAVGAGVAIIASR